MAIGGDCAVTYTRPSLYPGQYPNGAQMEAVLDQIDSLSLPAPTNTDATSRTTTSTGYTSTLTPATICGTAFTAPASGAVLLLWAVETSSSGANFALSSVAVYTGSSVGSGTSVLAASDDRMVRNNLTASLRMGVHHVLTGLTPGATYNVAMEHRVEGASTGTFARRGVSVVPVGA